MLVGMFLSVLQAAISVAALARGLAEATHSGDPAAVIRAMDEHLSHSGYSLKSLFRDEQRRVVTRLLESTLREAEAALALGATRWEMIRLSVLPYSRSGIVSAVMLGLGRALGETMAVAMVLSASGVVTLNLISNVNPSTIAANIALQFPEATGLGVNALIASGLVLFVITFAVNFTDGAPDAPLAVVGEANGLQGTEITFLPSPEVFTMTEFDFGTLEHRLRELAFLNSGVTIELTDNRGVEPRHVEMHYEGGTKAFVRYLDRSKAPLLDDPIMVVAERDGIQVEWEYATSLCRDTACTETS